LVKNISGAFCRVSGYYTLLVPLPGRPHNSPQAALVLLHGTLASLALPRLNSPEPFSFPVSFCSLDFVSLSRALPSTSRQGAALDPAGNQSPAPRARVRSLLLALRAFLFLFFSFSVFSF